MNEYGNLESVFITRVTAMEWGISDAQAETLYGGRGVMSLAKMLKRGPLPWELVHSAISRGDFRDWSGVVPYLHRSGVRFISKGRTDIGGLRCPHEVWSDGRIIFCRASGRFSQGWATRSAAQEIIALYDKATCYPHVPWSFSEAEVSMSRSSTREGV